MIRSMLIAALLVISAQGFAQEKRTIDNRAEQEAKTVVRKGEAQDRLDRTATESAQKAQPATRQEAERLRKQEAANQTQARRESLSTGAAESPEMTERRKQQAERRGLNAGNTNSDKAAEKEKAAAKAVASGQEVEKLQEREINAQKEAKVMIQELDLMIAQANQQIELLKEQVTELANDREANAEEITAKRQKMARLNQLVRQSEEEMARLKRGVYKQ